METKVITFEQLMDIATDLSGGNDGIRRPERLNEIPDFKKYVNWYSKIEYGSIFGIASMIAYSLSKGGHTITYKNKKYSTKQVLIATNTGWNLDDPKNIEHYDR